MTKKKFKHLVISNYYRVVNPFRKLYWFIFRPITRGVKAVIFWQDKVLLVHLSYGHRDWTLPGGKVDNGESFKEGAIREAWEEVGVRIENPEFFYEYKSDYEYKRNTVQCFAEHSSLGDFRVDEQEVVEAAWFRPNELPTNIRPSVKEILLKYSEWQKNHA